MVQSSSRILKLAVEEVGKDEGKGRRRVRLLPVLWHQMSGKNTSPKYMDHYNPWRVLYFVTKVMSVFTQIVVAKLYTLARRIPTPPCSHSLNTFQVPRYGNWTIVRSYTRGHTYTPLFMSSHTCMLQAYIRSPLRLYAETHVTSISLYLM
jgi:hypothetical protein